MDEPDLSAYLARTSNSLDASVFVGGSLFALRYDELLSASERGVRMRFLFADPAIGWVDDLVRPHGLDPMQYAQRIHVNASRALMVGEAVQVRWQPFPIPWWFGVSDDKSVFLKAIDLAGHLPAAEVRDSLHVAYFRGLFQSAWERARSVTATPASSPADSGQKTLRVFLCHSSGDKPEVRVLYRRLVADGAFPWLDEENLIPGQDWEFEILKAMRESDVILICLSRSSVEKRGFVQREIRAALRVADELPKGSIFLIPVRLEACEVPDELRHLHWVDLFDPKGYSLVLRALRIARVR